MVAYEIGLDLLKYNCTSEPDPDQDRDSPTRSDPAPSPFVRHNRKKKSDQPESSQNCGNWNEAKELTQ